MLKLLSKLMVKKEECFYQKRYIRKEVVESVINDKNFDKFLKE